MSNSPIDAFYAEREFVLLPIGLPISYRGIGPQNLEVLLSEIPGKSYQEIIQLARENRIRYILINQNTHEFNPDFEASIRSTELKEFYTYKEKDGSWITVYEVIY